MIKHNIYALGCTVRRALSVGILLVPGVMLAPLSYAQDKGSVIELEEVIVTARKAEEKLSEIPLSIAAYSADDLAKRNATSLVDIAQYTAGFSFENYTGATAPAPIIRGLSQNALTDRNQNVGTFVDGVHVQTQGNIDFSMIDLERIEIVKGPQNAQYGRSSFGGAINWVVKKPTLGEWDGRVATTVGSDKRRDLNGSVSIPLWGDKLAVRIAGNSTQFDGTYKNNYPGSTKGIATKTRGMKFAGTDGNLGGYDNEALQASVRFRPIDALTIDAMYYRSESIYESGASYNVQPRLASEIPALGLMNSLNCSPGPTGTALGVVPTFAGVNQLNCGELKLNPSQLIDDPRSSGNHTHSDLIVSRVEYKFSDTLAATYVYGHGSYDASNYGLSGRQPELIQSGSLANAYFAGLLGFPGKGALVFVSNPYTDQQSESNEFRVDGKFSGATWRVGYYNSRVSDIGALGNYDVRMPLSLDSTGQLAVAVLPNSAFQSRFKDKSEATFASVSVPFADTWTAEAEGRQAKETRTQTPLSGAIAPPPKDFKEFTPRVNIKWQPQAGWMFYASAAKGTKAGGFNGVTADVSTFEPEKNTTLELGGKQTLANGKLQLNYAIFLIDWKGLQLSVPDLIPSKPGIQDANYIGNVSGAKSKGMELEANYLLSDNLRANLAASYVQSTFNDDIVDTTYGRLCETSGTSVCVFLPRTATMAYGGSPIGGNDLPRSPRTKLSTGLEYLLGMNGMDLSLRGDLNYQSKYYVENLNLAFLPDRTLLNLGATLTSEDGAWSASLWGKNMTDKVYVSSAFAVSVAKQYIPGLGDGRTVGLTLRYKF